MTKHVAWRASHPATALVVDPCSFCPRMARYSVGLAHGMTETTYIASCSDCRCVLRLYLAYVAHFLSDKTMAFLAHSGRTVDVCEILLSVPSLLVQDAAYIVGADYRPLPMLIAQCMDLETNKAERYERLESAA